MARWRESRWRRSSPRKRWARRVIAFATFSKTLINFYSSFWRRRAVAAVAGPAWVLAMGAREAEAAAVPVGAAEREVPVAVFGKQASHPRQEEDRFRRMEEVAEVLVAEKA